MLVVGLPIIILLVAGAASVALWVSESQNVQRERAKSARAEASSLRERLDTTVARLSTTSGLFAASDHVSQSEFAEFSRSLMRQPTIQNVAHITRVPAAKRAGYERYYRVPIVDGAGETAPRAGRRREYFPYDLTAAPPKKPRTNTPDAGAEPIRAAALRRARDSGSAQATAPVTTFRDSIKALLVFAPMYQQAVPPPTVAQRRRALSGYVVGILPLDQLLPAAQQRMVALFDQGRRVTGARDLTSPTATPLTLAGRKFELQVATGIRADRTLSVAIALGGLLLAVTAGTVLLILLRRDDYAQRLVKQRLAEQRKAEAALEQSERRHRMLAEYASDWIALIDPDRRFTYCSPSIHNLLGHDPEQVVGRPFIDLVHPQDLGRVVQVLESIAEGHDPPRVELRQRHADGHWVPLETTLTVLRDQAGQVVEVRCASRDVSERHQLEEQLRRQATQDALTGLPNRRGLSERLEADLAASRRYGGGALLLIDLDEFKEINDQRGHSCGDEVLCRVAELLRERTRESDYVMRLGGDEFAVLLRRVEEDGAEAAAASILEALRSDPDLQRMAGHAVTGSAGVALLGTTPDQTAEKLLIEADQAMYQAKRAGRDRASTGNAAQASA